MRPPDPVLVTDLFSEERAALLSLLRGLDDRGWQAPTVCPGRSAGDIVRHLLADDIGVLSRGRDKAPGTFRGSWAELLAFINQQNEQWVAAMRRVSPRLLGELLELTGRLLHQYVASLDLSATGGVVSWAGPEPAPVWLDVAREYTERWLHQQQIRDAVGAPPLTRPRLFAPVLATFVHALPHTYRDVRQPDGALVRLSVTGAAGGTWFLLRSEGRWQLMVEAGGTPDAAATLDQDTAWRLWTKGINRATARERARLSGDEALAAKVLDAVSIIA
jgi:uncharacterized protein (TIGR03083 family)